MSANVFMADTELRVSETAGTVSLHIARTGDLDGDVSVLYGVSGISATDGQDFAGGFYSVTIPAGESGVTAPVQILNDSLAEASEALSFSLVDVTGATLWAPRTARITILDDETPAPPPNPEPPLASDYTVQSIPVVVGLGQPIRLQVSPVDAAQLFVASKDGVIRIADLSNGTASVFADLRSRTNSYVDRGLLGIALHPDFAAHPYVYAFYVADPPEATGMTGAAGRDGSGNRYSRLVRFTADAATGYRTMVPGSEVTLLGAAGQSSADISGGGAQDFTNPAFAGAAASDRYIDPDGTPAVVIDGFKQDYLKVDSVSHAGGDLAFGSDGALYVSVGDGSSFDYADPRTLDVQSLDSLSGKILRIDPLTGLGLPDNPFVADGVALDTNRAKVFQYGLRNPYAIDFDAQDRLFITDTGWNSYEEINVGGPGMNFGWPYYEGGDGGVPLPAPTYRDDPSAAAFYAAVADGTIPVAAPFRAFSHDSTDPGFQVQAITGGDIITASPAYPAGLQNSLIFTDFPQGEVYAVDVNDRTALKFLYRPGQNAPTDFVQAPDGYLYYADYPTGTVGRLTLTPASQPPPPIVLTLGTGSDTLVLRISQQAYLGSAQYTVKVDGVQFGGTLPAGALRSTGMSDTITLKGEWAPGPHTLTLTFLNDYYGGSPSADRNLYLDGVTYNGTPVSGTVASLSSSGARNFGFVEQAPSTGAAITLGSGGDSLVLRVSQQAYLGNAQYTVKMDGAQIGGTQTVSAQSLRTAGVYDTVTVKGDWAAGGHTLTVTFLNDLYGGSPSADRNLYLEGATYNGVAVPNTSTSIASTGFKNFAFADTASPPIGPVLGSGSDSLVLHVSQQAYLGNAQYTVKMDGAQIGGTQTVSAQSLRTAGVYDTVTVKGDWAAGGHTLTLTFLNDYYGGSPSTDRNLYLEGATYNGVAVPNTTASLPNAGPKNFAFTEPAATAMSATMDRWALAAPTSTAEAAGTPLPQQGQRAELVPGMLAQA